MKYIIKFLLGLIFSLCCLWIIEGACFRLIEKYANWRLYLAWGNPDQPSYNSILKNLPLDHFAEQPTRTIRPQHLGYWIGDEDKYTSKVLSFTRPSRDDFHEYVNNKLDPLLNFEIRNFGELQEVVLPGLKILASVSDVKNQKARRVGDPLEYAKAMFIRIVEDGETYSQRQSFADLERSFGFLLERGFACAILPVSSTEDLIFKITDFKKREEILSRNLFAWGDGIGATFIMESCQALPDLWKAVMLSDPDKFVSPPKAQLPWSYFVLPEDRRLMEDGLDFLYKWIKQGRVRDNLYSSRLSSLVKIGQNYQVEKTIPSTFATYAIFCSRFFEEFQGGELKQRQFFEKGLFDQDQNFSNNSLSKVDNSKALNLNRIEESIFELERAHEGVNIEKPNFDCKIIRGYREINDNNPELKLVSNRDLILKLGLGFEEMGNGVLEQISLKDPLFYRYYISLRAIEESPLN